jgi:hypothetical protein
VRNLFLGGFAAVALAAVAACTGGNSSPNVPYPGPTMVGSAAITSSGTTITLPATTGYGVGTAKVFGSGTVGVTQSASNPSGVPVLELKQRQTTGGAQPDSAANTPIAYVTVTASSATTLSQVTLTIAPTTTIPSGSYYLAFWNGAQWVTVGSPASISNGVVSVSSGSLSPTVSLASGASYYMAIYTGQIFVTPTPPPPPPVASPASLTLSEGQSSTIAVTTNPQLVITAVSSDTTVAQVSPASVNTQTGTTATFTVNAQLKVGTATITFTDPLGHTASTTVTVNDTAPTPEPSPATATIGLGDVATVTLSAKPSTAITIVSASSSVASLNTTDSATGASGSISVTTDTTGAATFYVVGASGGVTSITLTDPYSNTGTMNVTVSAITNGTFANGTTAWTPCSYSRAADANAGPVNAASPFPNTPEPAQTAPAETPVPVGSLPPISVTAPPANDNPGWSDYTSTSLTPNTGSVTFSQNGISETITTPASAPPVLGSNVMLLGSIEASVNAFPKGTFGVCQTITVPSAAPYLSLYVLEGGTEYTYKYADTEAAIFGSYSSNVASTLDSTLFSEDNCYVHPTTATPPGIWGGSGISGGGAGCWPSTYGGDPSGYENWLQGGFWSPRGPYDLSAYAGQTVTLFLGNWSYYHDTASYYAQFMYVGNVQMTGSSTFPTTAPLTKGRKLAITLHPKTTIQSAKPTAKPIH